MVRKVCDCNKERSSTPDGMELLLKTNPNFDTNAPPFEVRGCKAVFGGAFSE
jgi:hypothetical protein